jgi:hypothetical protein
MDGAALVARTAQEIADANHAFPHAANVKLSRATRVGDDPSTIHFIV